jgi:ATP-dependent helicase/nuclease subunit B
VSGRHERRLFEGGSPRVLVAPPSVAFLDLLAERMAADLTDPDDPLALADAIALLPNRRACRALVDAFAARTPGASILPAIKPLGDLDDDPDMWGPAALDLAIAPAIDPLRRRLHLAALVRRRDEAQGGASDPVRAIAAADELAKLLDAAAASDGVDWSRLNDLVAKSELAEHWRRSVDFLQIVARFWPLHLEEAGRSDPGARRNAQLDALAEVWRTAPPRGPVIIAGSTGSLPAVRRLMAVVAGLPRGLVVLPGLDADLDDEAWDSLGPQHPQFGLRTTLSSLRLARADLAWLAGSAESAEQTARRVLLREALAPADATADWLARLERAGGKDLAVEALRGLSCIAAATEDEEATLIAIALRAALETPGKTAALVTPDAGLARRVAAKLARWDILAPPSAGLALRETELGALLFLLAELGLDEASPRSLAALACNGRVGLDLEPARRTSARAEIVTLLRGPRRAQTLAELADRAQSDDARTALGAIADALAPVQAALSGENTDLAALAQALAFAAERAAEAPGEAGADRVWAGGEGAAAMKALRALAAEGDALEAIACADAPRAVQALLGGNATAPDDPEHPRLAIWGPLEARLQRRDLVILAGLNEGVWPAPPPEDPFLSRGMRTSLGIASPDVRIGLAAHDFAQFACAPEVLLTRAKRVGGSPTVASRWLWRLETLVAGAGAKSLLSPDTDWLALARMLDAPEVRAPAPPPKPRPPAHARPSSLRVTRVETLIRDPYAIYAEFVLGLRVRDSVGAEPGARERGIAIHAALEWFAAEVDPLAPGGAARLMARIDADLAGAGFSPEARMIDAARLEPAAHSFVAWAGAVARDGGVAYTEETGVLDLGDGMKLRCRADRIECDASGRATIVDFKTGTPPSDKQVRTGLAPQLPLEAATLAAGGFARAPRRRAARLVYWRFGGSDPGPSVVGGDDPAGLTDETHREAQALMRRYRQESQPFLSKPRAKFLLEHGDYDALARRGEWADAEGGE